MDTPSWLSEPETKKGTIEEVDLPASITPTAADIATPESTTVDEDTTGSRSDNRPWWMGEWHLFLIAIAILIIMNVPFLGWLMYPFFLLNTWVHEMCHAMAALMVGGSVISLQVFLDGSGLAKYSLPFSWHDEYEGRRGFVASAGYQGSCVVGFLFLILRRNSHIPRLGPILLGFMMLLSVMLYVRNAFGVVIVLVEGGLLLAAGLLLPSLWMKNLFLILSVTLTLAALTSITVLFRPTGEVNGEKINSDAVVVAENWFGQYILWALVWLLLGIVLALVGVRFPIPGRNKVCKAYLGRFIPMCREAGTDVVQYEAGSSTRASQSSTTNSGSTWSSGDDMPVV